MYARAISIVYEYTYVTTSSMLMVVANLLVHLFSSDVPSLTFFEFEKNSNKENKKGTERVLKSYPSVLANYCLCDQVHNIGE